MKEFEMILEIFNACAGNSRPERSFDEIEADSPEAYLREKHARDFGAFTKEVTEGGEIVYTLDNGSIKYKYTFTEI